MKSTSWQQSQNRNTPLGPLENLRLTWRLLRDPKVAPYAKLVLPILAVVYLVSPIDLIPDIILGLGQMDDLGVMAFLAYALISLVRRAGWSTLQESTTTRAGSQASTHGEVIDATYRVVSDPGTKQQSTSATKK